jgi:hypothetical protein
MNAPRPLTRERADHQTDVQQRQPIIGERHCGLSGRLSDDVKISTSVKVNSLCALGNYA